MQEEQAPLWSYQWHVQPLFCPPHIMSLTSSPSMWRQPKVKSIAPLGPKALLSRNYVQHMRNHDHGLATGRPTKRTHITGGGCGDYTYPTIPGPHVAKREFSTQTRAAGFETEDHLPGASAQGSPANAGRPLSSNTGSSPNPIQTPHNTGELQATHLTSDAEILFISVNVYQPTFIGHEHDYDAEILLISMTGDQPTMPPAGTYSAHGL